MRNILGLGLVCGACLVGGASRVARADPPLTQKASEATPPSRDEDMSIGGTKRTHRKDAASGGATGAPSYATLKCREMENNSLKSVKVENTPDGVIIRMTAKPERAAELQKVARMMVGCVGGGAGVDPQGGTSSTNR